MSNVKFAIIGTGSIAAAHAQVIAGLPDAAVGAVYGRSAVKVRDLAAQYDCRGYTDYRQMLKQADVDVVSICTASGMHADQGIQAALAGKHVIVEKPIDVNLEKADALIQTCQAQGVQLGIILQRRYSEGVATLKKLLDEGKLGKLLFGGCYIKLYRSQAYYDSAAWRGTWELDGGGVLMNQGVHYIDMLQYLAGPVAEVSGYCGTFGHVGLAVEDTASAGVRFASGALGVIEGTTCAYPGLVSRVDIYGTEGSAVIENDVLVSVQLKSGYDYKAGSSTDNAGVSNPGIDLECHRRQFREIVAAIRTGGKQPVDGREGRKALEVIMAIYKAALTGRHVALPLPDSLFMQEITKAGGFGRSLR